ncbi:720_t:CDS:2 [Funneliformis geosporum]|nr:720_t:CDS:2 [Funneliformis geosporum]
MAGLAHSFLLLLQYPNFTNLKEKSSSSTLFTSDSTDKIQNDFDRTEDNPAKNFIISFLSTYNWLNSVFLQQDAWDFWAVLSHSLIKIDDDIFMFNKEDGYKLPYDDNSSESEEENEEDMCIKVNQLNNKVTELNKKIDDVNNKIDKLLIKVT